MTPVSLTAGTDIARPRCVRALTWATLMPRQQVTGAKRGGAGGGGVIILFLLTRATVVVEMTEAEYIALSDIVLEVLFVRQM